MKKCFANPSFPAGVGACLHTTRGSRLCCPVLSPASSYELLDQVTSTPSDLKPPGDRLMLLSFPAEPSTSLTTEKAIMPHSMFHKTLTLRTISGNLHGPQLPAGPEIAQTRSRLALLRANSPNLCASQVLVPRGTSTGEGWGLAPRPPSPATSMSPLLSPCLG